MGKLQRTYKHVAPEMADKQRLQEYGAGIFPGITTRSALKKAIKKGLLKVNGAAATTATFIYTGDLIEFEAPERPAKAAPDIRLNVLYEDEFLAAVEKPAGLPVSGNGFRTLANALPQHLKVSREEDASVPQPVHRLDFPTTGILLIGKTASAISALNLMFEAKAITKTYFAVTIGQMESVGRIELEIDKKVCRTDFVKIQTVVSERFGQLNLVMFKPYTGRRHQIRIHSSSIGNPILGDREYCSKEQLLKGKGLYLHAFSVEFQHPFSNEKLELKCPIPLKFEKIFPELKGGEYSV